MNRLELFDFLKTFFAGLKSAASPPELKPFLDLVLSLKKELPLSVPLLRDFAEAGAGREPALLRRRIDRRYRRLCRVQEELKSLDFKKAGPGVSPEDYVFSRIDFSRYREMPEDDFERMVPEGLSDFGADFFEKNFGRGRDEILSVIGESYKKTGGAYRIQKESPLVLSVMRTLETSTEYSPLFTRAEIETEAKNLFDFAAGNAGREARAAGAEKLYPLLLHSLDNAIIRHDDGMTTRLFISRAGDLSGTFRPEDKPWTVTLVRGDG